MYKKHTERNLTFILNYIITRYYLQGCILAITTDNTSNNTIMSEKLTELLKERNLNIELINSNDEKILQLVSYLTYII